MHRLIGKVTVDDYFSSSSPARAPASIPQAERAARPRRLVRPLDEEEAVVVRVFEREEAAAPALVGRRRDLDAARAQEGVVVFNGLDREEEVDAAPAPRHRERHLR